MIQRGRLWRQKRQQLLESRAKKPNAGRTPWIVTSIEANGVRWCFGWRVCGSGTHGMGICSPEFQVLLPHPLICSPSYFLPLLIYPTPQPTHALFPPLFGSTNHPSVPVSAPFELLHTGNFASSLSPSVVSWPKTATYTDAEWPAEFLSHSVFCWRRVISVSFASSNSHLLTGCKFEDNFK